VPGPGLCRSVVQDRQRRVAGRIGIACDIETAQFCREQDGGEVIGGERCDHWHDAAQRQHIIEDGECFLGTVKLAERDPLIDQLRGNEGCGFGVELACSFAGFVGDWTGPQHPLRRLQSGSSCGLRLARHPFVPTSRILPSHITEWSDDEARCRRRLCRESPRATVTRNFSKRYPTGYAPAAL
jgi:hypothetical protein